MSSFYFLALVGYNQLTNEPAVYWDAPSLLCRICTILVLQGKIAIRRAGLSHLDGG